MILRYLFITICLAISASCAKEDSRLQDAVAVGDYLIASTLRAEPLSGRSSGSAEAVVRFGDGLKGKLKELRPALNADCITIVDSEIHDPEASHVIKILCDRKPVLAVRLRYDHNYRAFHVLGWWTSGL